MELGNPTRQMNNRMEIFVYSMQLGIVVQLKVTKSK